MSVTKADMTDDLIKQVTDLTRRLTDDREDLLEALYKVEHWLEDQYAGQPIDPPWVLRCVRDAIARAEGR